MKHLKISLIFTFIIAFATGVFFTAANVVYGVSTSTNNTDTCTTLNTYPAPFIQAPLNSQLISVDTPIRVDSPGASGLSISISQYLNGAVVVYEQHNFERRIDGWYKWNQTGTTPIFYSPENTLSFPWIISKYVDGEVKIEAYAGYKCGYSLNNPAKTKVFIKKPTTTTTDGSGSTTTTTNSTTSTPNTATSTTTTTTTTNTTLDPTKTYTTEEVKSYYENKYSSTDPNIYQKAPAETTQFWSLPKEEQKKIVIEYLKKNYAGSAVNEHVDNEKVLKMVATPVAENIKAENAAVKFEENKPKVELRGKAEPNSTVELYVFSEPLIVSTKADENGDWVYVLNQEISEGKHEVFVTVTDQSGAVTKRSEPLAFFLNTAQAAQVTSQNSVNSESFYQTTLFRYSIISGIIMILVLVVFFALLRYEKRKIAKELTAKA